MNLPSLKDNPIFYLGILIVIEQAIGHGTVSLTNVVPAAWTPYVTSWCNMLAFLGTTIMTALAAPGRVPTVPVAKVVAWLVVGILTLSLLAAPALAAPKTTPALTGHPVEDFQNAIHTAAPSASTGSNAALPCDFNLFANLSAHNLIASIHNCIESKMQSDIIAPLMLDTQAALASAQAYGGTGDTTGINCLKPGLAILQAAAGVTPTPAAAAATQPASSTPAASTSPATSSAPIPSANPSTTEPGPVLLFQKWREFVLAGGPSACKSWVNTTITGGSLLAQ